MKNYLASDLPDKLPYIIVDKILNNKQLSLYIERQELLYYKEILKDDLGDF